MRCLVTSAWVMLFGLTSLIAQEAVASATVVLEEKPLEYVFYVAAESADEVYRLVFDGRDVRVDKVVPVGCLPTDIEGPHGLAVSQDGRYWFLSMAHGKPFGILYKYETATDQLVGETELGMFPATMQMSPSTGLLYCVNFNLHGRMLPSSVSIVDPDVMAEVGRTTTGPMPHGSRLSPDGLMHYSCAMMSGHLFEMDATTFAVTRKLQLDENTPEGHDSKVKPTWAHPHPKLKKVYAALNGAAQIAEVDLETWRVVRRFSTGKGPYNLEVSPDGRHLVASYKTAGEVGLWDLVKGTEVARLPSARKVTHGVCITPDSRYAFVTSEGIGGEKGGVDVFDLTRSVKVASADVGLQAGGIAFWKTRPRTSSR